MRSEWRRGSVMDFQKAGLILVEDGNHGESRPRPDEFADTGVAFVRAADMFDGRVDFSSTSKINEKARARITKGIGAPGDVLLSHKGTVGKVALVPDDAPDFVCSPQTTFWRVLDDGILDRRYLHALLRSPAFHRQLATRSGETDMAPYVSLTSQRGLTLEFPPIESQRIIASIIGTIDEKIDLNRRLSKTLEELARAIFKSWFVQFDPVLAKARDRRPANMDLTTAKLFPRKTVDSELGPIPEGWRVEPFLDSFRLLSGGTPKTTNPAFWNGDIRWASAADVSQNGSFFLLETGRTITREGLSGSATQLIPADSVVVVARGATCGRFVVLGQTMAMNQTCYGLTAKEPRARWYLRFLFERLIHGLVAQAHGSVFDTITTSTFQSARSLMPDAQTLQAFEATVGPLMERIRSSARESRNLADIRDALLPKLISGELSVSNFERAVEATT